MPWLGRRGDANTAPAGRPTSEGAAKWNGQQKREIKSHKCLPMGPPGASEAGRPCESRVAGGPDIGWAGGAGANGGKAAIHHNFRNFLILGDLNFGPRYQILRLNLQMSKIPNFQLQIQPGLLKFGHYH